jgi:DNA invertase Pin-like site-specific DNA recombinase
VLQIRRVATTAKVRPELPSEFPEDLCTILIANRVGSWVCRRVAEFTVCLNPQDLTQKRVKLRDIGCTRIFEEKISGPKRERPELGNLLGHLRAGDVVTVTRLDRLARSTRDLLEIAERIKEAGAGLRSLAEPWADTTTPAGRMVLTVFAGMADFERSLIVERTGAGRIAAKARGVRFGPRPTLDAAQIVLARKLIDEDSRPVTEVARLLGVHRATLYRASIVLKLHVFS